MTQVPGSCFINFLTTFFTFFADPYLLDPDPQIFQSHFLDLMIFLRTALDPDPQTRIRI